MLGVTSPALNSAVDVIVFIVEPGATLAVSAKSLNPALLAMARMWPVDGWMTSIELCLCCLTALRAAASHARADRGGHGRVVAGREDARLAARHGLA